MESNGSAQVSMQAQPAKSRDACWTGVLYGYKDKIPVLRPYSKFSFPEFQKNKLTILLFLLGDELKYRFYNTTSMCSLFLGKKGK